MSRKERREQSELVSSLMNKLALASSPGVKSTKLYFSSQNSGGELIQSQTMYGKFSQTLASKTWGSSNQIVVPSTSMVSNVYLNIKLTLPPGAFVESGWGYRCIDQISFIWGSTNTSMITLPRESILMAVLKQCATAEAASEYIWEGGINTKDELGNISTTVTRTVEATIMIPLPWSVSCEELKPPFDCSLLAGSSPIIIRVDLARDPRELAGMNTTQAAAGNWNLLNISEATMLFTTVELADQSQSLSAVLRSNPELVVSYPFIHYQQFNSASIVSPSSGSGVWGGTSSDKQSVNLTSFIRSDLLSITFTLIDTIDDVASSVARVADPDGNYPAGLYAGRFNPIAPIDFEILYNGQRMFYSPGDGSFARTLTMRGRPGAGFFEGSSTYLDTAPTLQGGPDYFYPLVYEAGYMGAMMSCDQFFLANVARFPNQVITCSFRLPKVTRATQPTYRLVCTYAYQALAEVNSQGGVSVIFS